MDIGCNGQLVLASVFSGCDDLRSGGLRFREYRFALSDGEQ